MVTNRAGRRAPLDRGAGSGVVDEWRMSTGGVASSTGRRTRASSSAPLVRTNDGSGRVPRTQSGKHVPVAQAALWLQMAGAVQAAMGCR